MTSPVVGLTTSTLIGSSRAHAPRTARLGRSIEQETCPQRRRRAGTNRGPDGRSYNRPAPFYTRALTDGGAASSRWHAVCSASATGGGDAPGDRGRRLLRARLARARRLHGGAPGGAGGAVGID